MKFTVSVSSEKLPALASVSVPGADETQAIVNAFRALRSGQLTWYIGIYSLSNINANVLVKDVQKTGTNTYLVTFETKKYEVSSFLEINANNPEDAMNIFDQTNPQWYWNGIPIPKVDYSSYVKWVSKIEDVQPSNIGVEPLNLNLVYGDILGLDIGVPGSTGKIVVDDIEYVITNQHTVVQVPVSWVGIRSIPILYSGCSEGDIRYLPSSTEYIAQSSKANCSINISTNKASVPLDTIFTMIVDFNVVTNAEFLVNTIGGGVTRTLARGRADLTQKVLVLQYDSQHSWNQNQVLRVDMVSTEYYDVAISNSIGIVVS